MKNLDDTIKGLECCLKPADKLGNCPAECPYIHCCDPESNAIKADALNHLKEYKADIANRNKATAAFMPGLTEYNPALSWEELKEMTGKPIWCESGNSFHQWAGWYLVLRFWNDEFGEHVIVCGRSDDDESESTKYKFPKRYFSEVEVKNYETYSWQAYRKERE
ncbi:MAG: hypothetical protein IJI57_04825 [Flexilinea sp.]|nr:hypothetical protein [Flexilinea sp.]